MGKPSPPGSRRGTSSPPRATNPNRSRQATQEPTSVTPPAWPDAERDIITAERQAIDVSTQSAPGIGAQPPRDKRTLPSTSATHVSAIPALVPEIQSRDEPTTSIRPPSRLLRAVDETGLVDVVEALQTEEPGRPVVGIVSSEAVRRLYRRATLDSEGLHAEPGPLHQALFGDEPSTIVILYDASGSGGLSPAEAETLNELFDSPPRFLGQPIAPHVRIVGVVRSKDLQDERFSAAFQSRFDAFSSTSFPRAPSLSNCPRVTEQTRQPGDHIIDLKAAPHWRSLLFGKLEHRGAQAPRLNPGLLEEAIKSGSKRLIIANPPDDPEFELCLAQLRSGQGIEHFGHPIDLPKTLEVAFLDPQKTDCVMPPNISCARPGAPGERYGAVVNGATFATLFRQLRFADGRLHNEPGLLSGSISSLLIEDTLAPWQWRQLLGALNDGRDCTLIIAPHVDLPSFVQKAQLVPQQTSTPAAEPVEALRPGQAMRVTTPDAELACLSLQEHFPNVDIFDITPHTRSAELLQKVRFEGEGSERRIYVDDAPFLEKLADEDATLVLTGLESNPGLRAALAPLFQRPTQLIINGEKRPLKARLIQIERQPPVGSSRLCDMQGHWLNDEAAYNAALLTQLQKRFPNLELTAAHLENVRGAITDIVTALGRRSGSAPLRNDMATLMQIFAIVARRRQSVGGKDHQPSPSSIANATEALLGKAIADSVLGHFGGSDAEIRAFVKVKLRLALYRDATGNADVDTLATLLLDPAQHKAPTWQLARCFSTDVLQWCTKSQNLTFSDPGFSERMLSLAVDTLATHRPELSAALEARYPHEMGKRTGRVPQSGRHADIHPEVKAERRTLKYIQLLQSSGCLFLKGPPGAGKTHLATTALAEAFVHGEQRPQVLEHTIGANTSLDDLMPVFEALAAPSENGRETVVVFNEANLISPGIWRALEGFFRGDTWHVGGKTLRIHDRHLKKLIFTANDESESGRSHQPTLLSRVPTVHVDELHPALLCTRIATPMLATQLPAEAAERIAKQAVDLHLRMQRAQPTAVLSPRNLQEVVRRFIASGAPRTTPDEQNAALAQAFWEVHSGALSLEERDALKRFLELHSSIRLQLRPSGDAKQRLKHALRADAASGRPRFVLTDITEHYADTLDQGLELREYDRQNPGLPGQRMLLVEGPPGVGKDDLAQRVLDAADYTQVSIHQDPPDKGNAYLIVNAGAHLDTLLQTIQYAQKHGLVCIVRELNLVPPEILEGAVNNLLTGDAAPGFWLIGTTNPASFEGREVLSDAFCNRGIIERIPEPTSDALYGIVEGVATGAAKRHVHAIVKYHQNIAEKLANANKKLRPTPRELLRAVRRIHAGEPLNDVLDDVYRRHQFVVPDSATTAEEAKRKSIPEINSAQERRQRALELLVSLHARDCIKVELGANTPYGATRAERRTIVVDRDTTFTRQQTLALLQYEAQKRGVFIKGGKPSALIGIELICVVLDVERQHPALARRLRNVLNPEWFLGISKFVTLLQAPDQAPHSRALAGELATSVIAMSPQDRARCLQHLPELAQIFPWNQPVYSYVLRTLVESAPSLDAVAGGDAPVETMRALKARLAALPTTSAKHTAYAAPGRVASIPAADHAAEQLSGSLDPPSAPQTLEIPFPTEHLLGDGPAVEDVPSKAQTSANPEVGFGHRSGLTNRGPRKPVWGRWTPSDAASGADAYFPSAYKAVTDDRGRLQTRQQSHAFGYRGRRLGKMDLDFASIFRLAGQLYARLPVPENGQPDAVKINGRGIADGRIVACSDGSFAVPLMDAPGDEALAITYEVYERPPRREDGPAAYALPNQLSVETRQWPALNTFLRTMKRDAPAAIQAGQLASWLAENGLYSKSRETLQAYRQNAERNAVDQTLAVQAGVCQEFARLFASLAARALDLPARVVTGHRCVNGKLSATGHAWAEVFIDGQWQRFDPTPHRVDAETAKLLGRDPMVQAHIDAAPPTPPTSAEDFVKEVDLNLAARNAKTRPDLATFDSRVRQHAFLRTLFRTRLRGQTRYTNTPTGMIDDERCAAGDPDCFIEPSLGATLKPRPLVITTNALKRLNKPAHQCLEGLLHLGFQLTIIDPETRLSGTLTGPSHLELGMLTLEQAMLEVELARAYGGQPSLLPEDASDGWRAHHPAAAIPDAVLLDDHLEALQTAAVDVVSPEGPQQLEGMEWSLSLRAPAFTIGAMPHASFDAALNALALENSGDWFAASCLCSQTPEGDDPIPFTVATVATNTTTPHPVTLDLDGHYHVGDEILEDLHPSPDLQIHAAGDYVLAFKSGVITAYLNGKELATTHSNGILAVNNRSVLHNTANGLHLCRKDLSQEVAVFFRGLALQGNIVSAHPLVDGFLIQVDSELYTIGPTGRTQRVDDLEDTTLCIASNARGRTHLAKKLLCTADANGHIEVKERGRVIATAEFGEAPERLAISRSGEFLVAATRRRLMRWRLNTPVADDMR